MKKDIFRVKKALFYLLLSSLILLAGCGAGTEEFYMVPKNGATNNFYTPFGEAIFEQPPQPPKAVSGIDFDLEIPLDYNGKHFSEAIYFEYPSPPNAKVDRIRAIYNSQRDNPVEIEENVYPPEAKTSSYWESNSEGRAILDQFLSPSDVVCQVGGMYRGDLIVQNGWQPRVLAYEKDGGLFGGDIRHYVYPPKLSHTGELFYCKTTLDLFDSIKIPSSWKGANLHVYCGDGNKVIRTSENFGYLFQDLNVYKACIVKNLDIEETYENTILYGLEVGNIAIDGSTVESELDPADTADDSQLFRSLVVERSSSDPTSDPKEHDSSGSGKYRFFPDSNEDGTGDLDGSEYHFIRDHSTRQFVMYRTQTSEQALFISLSHLISAEFDMSNVHFDLTRTLLLRSSEHENKDIYGYEIPYKFIDASANDNIKPVYQIFFDGFGNNMGEICEESLAAYNPSTGTSTNFDRTHLVHCQGSDILIDSQSFQGDNGFNLFKNIILDLETTLDEKVSGPDSNDFIVTEPFPPGVDPRALGDGDAGRVGGNPGDGVGDPPTTS